MNLSRTQILAFNLIIALSYCIVLLDERFVVNLLNEDGPIEYATAFFFFFAFAYFLRSYAAARTHLNPAEFGRGQKISYLVLALLMLIAMGEEISWGQRIFNWETPAVIAEINNQKETNLHNLAFLQGNKLDSEDRSFVRMLINPLRLFFIFSFVYFICIPMLNCVSETARAVFQRMGIPIPPVWISTLFLTNYGILKAVDVAIGELTEIYELDELKEMYYGLFYAVASFTEFRNQLKNTKVSTLTTFRV